MYVEISYRDKNQASRVMRLVTPDIKIIPFLAKKKNRKFDHIIGEPKILTEQDYEQDKKKGYVL
jgi:hypothetical protein